MAGIATTPPHQFTWDADLQCFVVTSVQLGSSNDALTPELPSILILTGSSEWGRLLLAAGLVENGCTNTKKIFRDIICNQFSSAGENPSVIVQTAKPSWQVCLLKWFRTLRHRLGVDTNVAKTYSPDIRPQDQQFSWMNLNTDSENFYRPDWKLKVPMDQNLLKLTVISYFRQTSESNLPRKLAPDFVSFSLSPYPSVRWCRTRLKRGKISFVMTDSNALIAYCQCFDLR